MMLSCACPMLASHDSRPQGVGRDRCPVLKPRGPNPHPLAFHGYAGVPSWGLCFEHGQIIHEDRPDNGVAEADGSGPTDLRDRDSIAWLRERSRYVVETRAADVTVTPVPVACFGGSSYCTFEPFVHPCADLRACCATLGCHAAALRTPPTSCGLSGTLSRSTAHSSATC